MRKVVMALAATASCIALILGVKAQSAGAPRSALGVSAAGGTRHSGTPTSSAASPSGRAAKPTAGKPIAGKATSAGRSGHFTGSVIDTPYGPVQVRAVMTAGRLTDVAVLQQTSGGRSGTIDSYALPILTSEALKKQSADIDVVSGATYTSSGYAQSLQAALDAARR
jgi:uncharacterized protein with FMN-binding domain